MCSSDLTMKNLKQMMLTMYQTQKGQGDQQAAAAENQSAMGDAFDTAIDRDNLVGGAFDLNDPVHQDLAGTVHGNEIGRTVAFAGYDDDPAILLGYVRNHRVTDNQGRNPAGKFDKLGLIDIDHDGVSRELGERGHRAQQNSKH